MRPSQWCENTRQVVGVIAILLAVCFWLWAGFSCSDSALRRHDRSQMEQTCAESKASCEESP